MAKSRATVCELDVAVRDFCVTLTPCPVWIMFRCHYGVHHGRGSSELSPFPDFIRCIWRKQRVFREPGFRCSLRGHLKLFSSLTLPVVFLSRG